MIGEIWTYKATKPSDNLEKVRPILTIGNDEDNKLNFVDINYVIVSSSASCGKFDVKLDEKAAKSIGLKSFFRDKNDQNLYWFTNKIRP